MCTFVLIYTKTREMCHVIRFDITSVFFGVMLIYIDHAATFIFLRRSIEYTSSILLYHHVYFALTSLFSFKWILWVPLHVQNLLYFIYFIVLSRLVRRQVFCYTKHPSRDLFYYRPCPCRAAFDWAGRTWPVGSFFRGDRTRDSQLSRWACHGTVLKHGVLLSLTDNTFRNSKTSLITLLFITTASSNKTSRSSVLTSFLGQL